MKCKFCGQELLDEAIYCNNCGKKIKEKNMPVDTIVPTGDNAKKDIGISRLFWIAGFIISIFYCIDGIWGTDIIKEINPFTKSEKTIRDIYDENEIRGELEKYIIAQKKTLPIVISDGITMTDVVLDGKNLVFTAEIEGALPSDYTQQIIDDLKEQILSSGVLNEDLNRIFREFGYGVIYSYVNEYEEALYKIHIYPHEL